MCNIMYPPVLFLLSVLLSPLQEDLFGDRFEALHPKPNELLYVKSCLNCKFVVKDRLAKVIVGERMV